MEEIRNTGSQTKLRDDLIALRQSLKDQEKAQTGHTPAVCSDESVDEMLRLMPKKPTDFYSIPGIGPAFVEKYAEKFLAVILRDEQKQEVSDATLSTLRELSKKLISITRNNRMLFLPRLSPKYAVDLFDPAGRYDPLDILFRASAPLTVADVTDQDLPRNDPARERYRNLVGLIRETIRDQRDKGQNDLYVGYPFVQGCLVGGEFGIRAPLCLFPVTLDRSTANITVSADPTRDILYNSTLILAHDKFNSLDTALPDCALEEAEPEKQTEFIHNIQILLNKMEWLVGALLKMAKLDAHAIDFIKNDIRTSELLEAVKPSVEILLDIHNLTIELKQDCIIHCDKRWTTEALTNIIKNAIEYSPDGSVIEIDSGENPMYSWISVKDSGMGMDKTEYAALFKRFENSTNASSFMSRYNPFL